MIKVEATWKSGSVTKKYFLELDNARKAREELNKNRGVRRVIILIIGNKEE